MAIWIANTAAIAAPLLGFAAGVFFAKWMGQRRRQRLDSTGAELRRSREDNSNRASRTA